MCMAGGGIPNTWFDGVLVSQHAGPKLTMYATGVSAATMIHHRNRRLSQNSVIGPRGFRAGSLMPGILPQRRRGREGECAVTSDYIKEGTDRLVRPGSMN